MGFKLVEHGTEDADDEIETDLNTSDPAIALKKALDYVAQLKAAGFEVEKNEGHSDRGHAYANKNHVDETVWNYVTTEGVDRSFCII